MSLRRVFFLSIFCAIARLGAAEVPIEFSGVITDGAKTRFAFTDKASSQTTWVELGAEVSGYTVTRYEPKEETITLKRGLEEFPLQLIAAKSTEAAAATTPAVAAGAPPATEATAGAIKNNLRHLVVAARQFQLETGATTATVADLVGPDKYIKQLTPVDGENYSGLTFGPGAANLSVTTASGITVTVDTGPALATLGNVAPPPSAAPLAPPVQPAGAAPAPTGPINTSHVVREGDTLAKIAEASGVPEQQLKVLNPEVNPSSLKVGQPIRIR